MPPKDVTRIRKLMEEHGVVIHSVDDPAVFLSPAQATALCGMLRTPTVLPTKGYAIRVATNKKLGDELWMEPQGKQYKLYVYKP